jgi:indole-3-glycerol phosphate synthase
MVGACVVSTYAQVTRASEWSADKYDYLMTVTYLDEIVDAHRQRAQRDTRDWRTRLSTTRYNGPSFREALRVSSSSKVAVIAEIKRKSPSKGWIDENLNASDLAFCYERGGASAISVLTDENYFAGSQKDLAAVRERVALPILRKDFTVSENDVLDAASMGASAVLLIVAVLNDEELRRFLDVAEECGIDALVEVHDQLEAERALGAGASIVGVNQRDLRTFDVDEKRAGNLGSWLPSSVVRVAESGMKTIDDVQRAGAAGFDAVLVGETFVRSLTPEDSVRAFASVERRQ